MVPFEELSRLGILAFKNGLRLHFDSVLLLNNKANPSAILLSVLSMEEFGKYFSLSSYVFYTKGHEDRDEEFEKKFLEKLYSHPFKQRAIFGRDGFEPSSVNFNKAKNRIFEDLKQKSLYVGYQREKGKLLFDKGINNPNEISEEVAKKQIKFINDLIIKMTEDKVKGIVEMDEEEINDMLDTGLLQKLNGIID